MIFPCGTANYYSICPSDQTQTPHLYLLQLLDTNQLTNPYMWCMDKALVRNRIQPSGFALVLYEVTALVHYTPYTTGRGGLTITQHTGMCSSEL